MIDAHCHIDQFKKPFEIAQRAERERITTIGVTSLPEHFELGYQHLKNFKHVKLALGYHPMLAGNQKFNEPLFKTSSEKTSYIGEVGLDFSGKDQAKRNLQVDILKKIFRIISEQPRFLSLHSRKAEKSLFDILIHHKIKNAVFHWYSGPLNLIDKIVNAGHFFSINPAMIKSKNGQKIIERIPADRILTETDGPYVMAKGKPAEPKDVRLVIDHLKIIWNKSFEEIDQIIQGNFDGLVKSQKITNR
ncbi:MAG: TatD family deoxyribonuclease [Candidatus Electrothrix sp. AUS4]|nr:TatD family deoxyribonuclease [Candidatus Electrothrix sp. AUS4]